MRGDCSVGERMAEYRRKQRHRQFGTERSRSCQPSRAKDSQGASTTARQCTMSQWAIPGHHHGWASQWRWVGARHTHLESGPVHTNLGVENWREQAPTPARVHWVRDEDVGHHGAEV